VDLVGERREARHEGEHDGGAGSTIEAVVPSSRSWLVPVPWKEWPLPAKPWPAWPQPAWLWRFDRQRFGLRLRGRLARPRIEGKGDEAGRTRADRSDDQRSRQTEELDEDEARRGRPDDRPDRVRCVQPPERRAQVAGPSAQVAGQCRKRGAHEDRRRPEGKERQDEADEGEGEWRGLERAECPAIDLMEKSERDRRRQDDDDEYLLGRA
jgi:hypothetical protein